MSPCQVNKVLIKNLKTEPTFEKHKKLDLEATLKYVNDTKQVNAMSDRCEKSVQSEIVLGRICSIL